MPKALEDLRSKIGASLSGKKSPRTKKPYTESEIFAIAQAQFKKMKGKKEIKYCSKANLKYKEDDKDFHVSGLIATSHPDRAESTDGKVDYIGDIIPKGTLQRITEQLNNKFLPQAGMVSESHDWLKADDPSLPAAGVMNRDKPAELIQLEDGEWGVHVDTVVAKSHPNYDNIKSDIKQGVYPGFSIEYETNNFVPTVKEGKRYRLLTDISMEGFGFANGRLIANPHAEITDFGYKELVSKTKGETMKDKKPDVKEDPKPDTEDTPKEPAPVAEDKPADAPKDDAPTEDAPKEDKPAEEATEETKTVTAEQFAKLEKLEAKETEDARNEEVKAAVQTQIKEILGKSAPQLNIGETTEKKEFKEMVEHPYFKAQALMKELDKPMKSNEERTFLHKQAIDLQYKEAANVANQLMVGGVPLYQNWMTQGFSGELAMKQKDLQLTEVGNRVEIKETRLHKIEMKVGEGLQTDTNLAHASWTYGSYYQSPVELNDIYGQTLINQLNDQTTTWGKLSKQDFSGRSQIQFRARTGRNSTAGGYSEGVNLAYGTDFSGTVGRSKFQQPFAYYRVLVAVTGQEIQFSKAPGGIGDIWADEIKWSGVDLQVVLNQAILGTGNGQSESASLGFEGLILGTSGTLYARNIATFTTLKSHKESVSGRVDLELLRKMIRYTEAGNTSTITNSNANRNDLVFFCNHIQRDFIYSLIQDMQRTVPTSARVGFEGVLELDGVPVFADKDVNTDDIFLIDTAHTKIGMNLPPTLEPLPVTADAKAAQIKTYFNLFSDAPSNNYWAYGLATS